MPKKKLNLGCGKDIRAGYINADIVDLPGVDVVADIEKNLPFENEYFDEIYIDNVLEHVRNLDGLLRELHRISKKNGIVRIIVPHFSFCGSYTDPTHKRFFGYYSMDYFSDEGDYNYYTDIRYEIVRRKILFFWVNNKKKRIKSRFVTWVINIWPLFYERFLCWMLPANCIYFELKVVK